MKRAGLRLLKAAALVVAVLLAALFFRRDGEAFSRGVEAVVCRVASLEGQGRLLQTQAQPAFCFRAPPFPLRQRSFFSAASSSNATKAFPPPGAVAVAKAAQRSAAAAVARPLHTFLRASGSQSFESLPFSSPVRLLRSLLQRMRVAVVAPSSILLWWSLLRLNQARAVFEEAVCCSLAILFNLAEAGLARQSSYLRSGGSESQFGSLLWRVAEKGKVFASDWSFRAAQRRWRAASSLSMNWAFAWLSERELGLETLPTARHCSASAKTGWSVFASLR